MISRNQPLLNMAAVFIVGLFAFAVYRAVTDPGPGLQMNAAPVEKRVSMRYVAKTVSVKPELRPDRLPQYGDRHLEEGSANIVTSVVVNYRAFDTLGEVLVLFASAVAVGMMMELRKKKKPAAPSDIQKRALPLINALIAALGMSIIIHGHLSPGGGFPGGAVIASGLLLTALVLGRVPGLKVFPVMEGFAGLAILAIGFLALGQSRPFLTNILGSGRIGDLVSGGMVPVLYILIGLKVATELAGIGGAFLGSGEGDA